MIRILFNGTYNLIHFIKNDIPLHFYREWLWAKFKADLKVLLWLTITAPYGILALVSVACYCISYAFEQLQELLPKWFFLNGRHRKEQFAIVEKIKKWEKQRNAKL